MLENENEILSSLLEDDTLTPSDISNQIAKMKKITEIKNKYKDKIKERKDGRQFYVIINRKQISSTTYNGLINKLYELEYGRQNFCMKQLFPEYMKWKKEYTPVSPKTLREYVIIWDNYLDHLKLVDIPICELKRKDFVDVFRLLTKDRELKKKQFNNIKSVLNGILNYAIEEELIVHNPIIDIDCKQFAFKPTNHRNDVVTIEQREQILEHLKNDNSLSSLAIRFDFHMVLRIAELLALKWSDIDGDYIHIQRQRLLNNEMNDDLSFTPKCYENVDHIKGNTDQGFRDIPITTTTWDILSKVKEINPDGEFIFMQDGKHLSQDAFNRKLKKACKELGLPEFSSHKIRFSSASILYTKGMPLTELQKLLGHTTTAMTLHYIRSVTSKEDTFKIMQNALN